VVGFGFFEYFFDQRDPRSSAVRFCFLIAAILAILAIGRVRKSPVTITNTAPF
jgi:hypothetical protein